MKEKKYLIHFLAMMIILSLFLLPTPLQAASKHQKACAAYRKFLNKVIQTKSLEFYWDGKKTKQSISPSYSSFCLNDLNSDGIPELRIDAGVYGSNLVLYTYYKGKIKQIRLENRVSFKRFKGKKKIFLEEHDTRGYYSYSYHRIEKGKLSTVAWRSFNSYTGQDSYYVGKKGGSKEAFLNVLKKYGVTLSTSFGSEGKKGPITKAAVKKYCK